MSIACGVVRPFNAAAKLEVPRWQDEQRNVEVLPGLLEVRHVLAITVEQGRRLGRPGDGCGHLYNALGAVASGSITVVGHQLLADRRNHIELLAQFAFAGKGPVINLDEFAQLLFTLPVSPAFGETIEASAALVLNVSPAQGSGHDASQAHILGKDSADGGLTEFDPLSLDHHARSALVHGGSQRSMELTRRLLVRVD